MATLRVGYVMHPYTPPIRGQYVGGLGDVDPQEGQPSRAVITYTLLGLIGLVLVSSWSLSRR